MIRGGPSRSKRDCQKAGNPDVSTRKNNSRALFCFCFFLDRGAGKQNKQKEKAQDLFCVFFFFTGEAGFSFGPAAARPWEAVAAKFSSGGGGIFGIVSMG